MSQNIIVQSYVGHSRWTIIADSNYTTSAKFRDGDNGDGPPALIPALSRKRHLGTNIPESLIIGLVPSSAMNGRGYSVGGSTGWNEESRPTGKSSAEARGDGGMGVDGLS